MSGEHAYRERMASETWSQREMLLSGIKLGVLVIAVQLLALLVMAWQHQGNALTGIIVGLLLAVGSEGFMIYKLGELHSERREGPFVTSPGEPQA